MLIITFTDESLCFRHHHMLCIHYSIYPSSQLLAGKYAIYYTKLTDKESKLNNEEDIHGHRVLSFYKKKATKIYLYCELPVSPLRNKRTCLKSL